MSSLQNHPDFTVLQQRNQDLESQLDQFQLVFQDLIKENSNLKQKLEDQQLETQNTLKTASENDRNDIENLARNLDLVLAEKTVILEEKVKFEALYRVILQTCHENGRKWPKMA